jgi:hypothetical protein
MANQLQERYAEALLHRISSDAHPSVTQMDMFEAIAPMRQRVEYILFLLEKIENDNFPSLPMMRRVERLIAEFGS